MIDQLSTVTASFDNRAPTYDASVMHRDLAYAVADFAALDGVRVVLDVATGTGLVLRAIAARDPHLHLIGVDISAGMLEVARDKLPTGKFVEGRAEQLPVRGGTIDLVTCVTAMHLMADPGVVFAEIARAMAPRGRLVLATFRPPPGRPAARARTGRIARTTRLSRPRTSWLRQPRPPASRSAATRPDATATTSACSPNWSADADPQRSVLQRPPPATPVPRRHELS